MVNKCFLLLTEAASLTFQTRFPELGPRSRRRPSVDDVGQLSTEIVEELVVIPYHSKVALQLTVVSLIG